MPSNQEIATSKTAKLVLAGLLTAVLVCAACGKVSGLRTSGGTTSTATGGNGGGTATSTSGGATGGSTGGHLSTASGGSTGTGGNVATGGRTASGGGSTGAGGNVATGGRTAGSGGSTAAGGRSRPVGARPAVAPGAAPVLAGAALWRDLEAAAPLQAEVRRSAEHARRAAPPARASRAMRTREMAASSPPGTARATSPS